jgi:hypothetical protein
MNDSTISTGQANSPFNKDDKSQNGKEEDKIIMPAGSSFE